MRTRVTIECLGPFPDGVAPAPTVLLFDDTHIVTTRPERKEYLSLGDPRPTFVPGKIVTTVITGSGSWPPPAEIQHEEGG